MSKIEEALEELALPICEKFGVYIYETEYKKEGETFYLRLFIDKEGGVTVDDCENVSRALNPILDEKDPIKEAYIFEVSSPGLDRILSRPWHYEKALGRDIDVRLFMPFDGKKIFSGILTDFSDSSFTILENGKEITIEKKIAASVRLAVKF